VNRLPNRGKIPASRVTRLAKQAARRSVLGLAVRWAARMIYEVQR